MGKVRNTTNYIFPPPTKKIRTLGTPTSVKEDYRVIKGTVCDGWNWFHPVWNTRDLSLQRGMVKALTLP
jgi:hypothetical protein